MSVFHLEITEHAGQFGETHTAEAAVIAAALNSVAQRVGSGTNVGTEATPEAITVNRVPVGRFWVGPASHRAKHQAAHAKAAADGAEHRAKTGAAT